MLLRKIRRREKTVETGSSCPRSRSRVQWLIPTERAGVTSQAAIPSTVMVITPDSDTRARRESVNEFAADVLVYASRIRFSTRVIRSVLV